MKNIGVILAGGVGQRFGASIPKQFIKLAGKMVIEHTVEIFERSADIDEIMIVSIPEYSDLIWELSKKNNWTKVQKVVASGSDRFGSTNSAIQALSAYPASTKVLFHDAVRPLLALDAISQCVDMLENFDAVDVVIPSNDTLVAVYDNGCISDIPSRSHMRRGQTPQAFRLKTIQDAYALAAKQNRRDFTCDCGVVRAMLPRLQVATVPGSETNIKITNPLDLFLAEKLIQSSGTTLTFEANRLDLLKGKNIAIFGGTSGIGKAVRDLAVINGARVHVASRTKEGVDVANMESVRDFLTQVVQDSGPIDAVINTAGILIKKPLTRMTPEEINLVVGANYNGAVNVAYAAKQHLVKTQGVLVNFTSSSYTRGRAFYAIYSSTKCAVVNLTQALAEEWVDEGVRVQCINPERTQTPMRTTNFGAEDPDTLLRPEVVAQSTLAALLSQHTGLIVDVRRNA
ncbi:2-C-methyl-D-erythritol 4-phosphate cytidylyltransferase [Mycoplana sp. BE70]|uniref:bifunctional cytidylyltransferase/SDR family oxidoreductase n=1 Tax=Mycoplana sp. BE70 TaxID=2817775 RepID=UPI002862561B|nr:bifunctional cytidylyltransferase/SDR family oxidoreductase [Mycoplana sp. BE70]MDR6757608.1 2-C-methyl-D-erythritol 4-phosphate cytidylyltransferase [Mycoplana sp. BE70]